MAPTRPMSESSFHSINEISSLGEPQTPDERGSLCNRFILEAGMKFNTEAFKDIIATNDDDVIDDHQKDKRPPKIWISKSASMDDDLE